MMTKREISDKEKKLVLLEIMDEIHDFCISNNISYFLVAGSLLGAVRHQGFIPWDDDMDIGLLRRDYEYLIHHFKSRSGNIEILSVENKKNYIWPFAKAIHKKTELIELGYEKSAIGVYVDIFPFDCIDADYEKAKTIFKKSNLWKKLLTLKYLRINRRRSIVKNIAVILGKILYLIPDIYLIDKVNEFGRRNPSSAARYACCFSGSWGLKEIMKAEDFTAAVPGQFEGRNYMMPQGYEDYLRNIYGDYMTPPPVEKRVTHHANTAYWKT